MTAHPPKAALITPERLAWMRSYHRQCLGWGVFHVILDDGNWKSTAVLAPGPEGAAYHRERNEWMDGIEEMVEWFNKLTPSQRRRLSSRIEREWLIVNGYRP